MISIESLLMNYYQSFCLSKFDALTILSIIREAKLQNQQCSYDSVSHRWHYEFGSIHQFDCMHLHKMYFVGNLNVNSYHRVDLLIRSIDLAIQWMDDIQMKRMIQVLGDGNKHRDQLIEFAPLLFAMPMKKAIYEEENIGNTKRVDWTLYWSKPPCIRIEVKNRVDVNMKAMYKQMVQLDESGVMGAPETDAVALFKNIESKYNQCNPVEALQGAWINTCVKLQRDIIENYYYNKIDIKKLHFIVINTFGKPDCEIVCRPSINKKFLVEQLGLYEYEGLKLF